jgi:NADP-dependent aldehyde dehydrogenase
MRVLITGAAGAMGRMLRPRLARPGRVLRLLDREPLPVGDDGAELVRADVTDPAAVAAACADVAAVVHLAGIASEAPFEEILDVNVRGTAVVLEAARAAGVRRVVLASSNHAVGFHPRPADGADAPADLSPRPDTFYGWSKAANEALGALYADRFGLAVTALRIGSCVEEPYDTRSLSTWLSPGDAARLVDACLTTTAAGFRTVWGVSGNTRRWWSLAEAGELGYRPADDAEAYAGGRIAASGDADLGRVGGVFCTTPLGERMG